MSKNLPHQEITCEKKTSATAKISEIDAQMILLRDTICKGASPEEFSLFAMICKKTGLDPFSRQIFMVPRWDSKLNRNNMTPQTSIDGYRVIAERTGNYSPSKEATYTYDSNNQLVSATAYVKKLTRDGTWHEVSGTAFWAEYSQKSKDGKLAQFWARMPHVMLAKCAEANVLRKAFPAEMCGLYTEEEMSNSITTQENPTPAISQENAAPAKQVETLQPAVVEEETLSFAQIEELERLVGRDSPRILAALDAFNKKSLTQIPLRHYHVLKNSFSRPAPKQKQA